MKHRSASLGRSFLLLSAVTALATALAGCAGTGSLFSKPGASPVPSQHRRVTDDFVFVEVRRGDTLSSLASAYLKDPRRDWVIARFNGITSVRPGEAVAIPLKPFDPGGLSRQRYQTVPVLSYHKFSEDRGDTMTVTRRAFEEQMKFLKVNGFTVVTIDELFDFLDFKVDLPEKAVVLTFDDGWRSMYDIAAPILRKYGYPATLFVSTGMITGSRTTLSWDQVLELQRNGMDIQGHTVDHRNLRELKAGEDVAAYLADLERELKVSSETIRSKTGSQVRYLAYPYGATSHLVVALMKKLGYRGAFTVKRGGNPFFTDNYRVNRSMIYGDFDLARFEKNLVVTDRRALR